MYSIDDYERLRKQRWISSTKLNPNRRNANDNQKQLLLYD